MPTREGDEALVNPYVLQQLVIVIQPKFHQQPNESGMLCVDFVSSDNFNDLLGVLLKNKSVRVHRRKKTLRKNAWNTQPK